MALGTLDRTPPPFFRQGPSALTKLSLLFGPGHSVPDGRRRARFQHHPAAARHGGHHAVPAAARAARAGRGAVGRRCLFLGPRRHALQLPRKRRVSELARESVRVHAGRPAAPRRTRGCGHCSSCAPSLDRAGAGGRAALRGGRPVLAQGHHRPRRHQQRHPRLAGDQRGRRARPGHARVPAVIGSDAAHRPRRRHSSAQPPHAARAAPAFGGGNAAIGSQLEMRFMAGNADVQVGDVLTTSGVDGVYPPGLKVATVAAVDRKVDSGFARIVAHAGTAAGRRGAPRARSSSPPGCSCRRKPQAASEPASAAKGGKKGARSMKAVRE